MVIEDPFSPKRQNYTDRRSFRPKHYRLAAPTDRLAAFLIDVLFLFPLINLIFAPFYRESMRAYLYHFDHIAFYLVGFGALTLFVVTTAYFTLSLRLWGASPGKRILGLKVQPPEGQDHITVAQALLRSVFVGFEILFLGLPLIGAFTDKKRRPFHDRIADTVVVSEKEYYTVAPSHWERKMARSFYMCVVLFFSMLATPYVVNIYNQFTSANLSFTQDHYLCAGVSKAKKDWSEAGESRLEVAMTLYAAGEVEESCLNKEADFALWAQKEKSTAYLAKAFSLSENSVLSDTYLDKVCIEDKDSDACFLSQLVTYWTAGKINEISNDLFDKVTVSSSFVKLWSVRHFLSSQHLDQVLRLIDTLPNSGSIGHFTSSYRTKALYLQGNSESALISLKSSLENLDLRLRMRLAAWYCVEQTNLGCPEQESYACQSFSKNFADKWDFANESEIALGVLRSSECSSLKGEGLHQLAGKSPSTDLRMFLEGIAFIKDGKNKKATKKLKSLAKIGLINGGSIAHEAAIRWVKLDPSFENLSFVENIWTREASPTRSWERLGVELMNLYYNKGMKSQSYKIANKIVDLRPYSVKGMQALALQAFSKGKRRKARQIALELRKKRLGPIKGRSPASLDRGRPMDGAWSKVLRDLRVSER